jgi:flagellar biosynthesis protein FliR
MFLTTEHAGWLLERGALVALLWARTFGMASVAPALGAPELGWRFRLGLSALLAIAVMPVVAPSVAPPTEAAMLVRACLVELLIGAAIGWMASLVVAGARQGGELVAAQAGLSPASLLDIDCAEGLTPLGHFYGIVALMVFLAIGGPMALVKALLESYRVAPAGEFGLAEPSLQAAFGLVGQGLVVALQVAAPVALALVLTGIALGLLGRAAPGLQTLALALPARAAIALVLLFASLGGLVATLAACWSGLGTPGETLFSVF